MRKIQVYVKKTESSADLPLPAYMSLQAAGMDLYASITGSMVIHSGKFVSVPTGICIALPAGYEAQVRPRSGLAFKYGITVLNSPGTIDADYRGEISIILINLGDKDFEIKRGERVAQLVINKIERADFIESDVLPDTDRGDGGFGSTGI
jgi:dUTP pyrophosphatase